MKKAITLFVGIVLMAGSASAQDAPRGDVAKGKTLYVSTGCYECHNYSGAGSSQGARLISPPTFQRFLAQMRRPSSVMPPYEANVLSDAQVADIYAYVQTLPKPPDANSIRLLK